MDTIGHQFVPKVYILVLKEPFGTIQMQQNQDLQAIELPRKQPRIQVPLPQEVMDRLEQLSDIDGRPTSNLSSMLIQAAIELIDEQGFRLVGGKLRKVVEQPFEEIE